MHVFPFVQNTATFYSFIALLLGYIMTTFTQGQGNDILTNNSKGKFPHNPLPLFLPFFPTPLQLHDKNKIYHQMLYKVS